ncbi:MAG: excinuclease ABC subunit UvrA [Bacteroidetes bacterium]|nr:excinuclease ABC subunit UvrA [Bacteroidota bacterium]
MGKQRMAKTKAKTPVSSEPEASPASQDAIIVRGARVHNLRNVDLVVPREKLVVITGISGSGKSSLAFDTIYAEGQRRYVESLSAYARQFLDMMERPDVDSIEGLAPAVSIEQKTIGNSPRSTVGTVTEIYDFLRLLFARLGTQYCTNCDIPVQRQSLDQIIEAIASNPAGTKLTILATYVRARKGHYRELFAEALRMGFTKVRIDGELKDLLDGMQVDRYKVHTIELVIDRIVHSDTSSERLAKSVESALKLGKGLITVLAEEPGGYTSELLFSEKLSCPKCGRSYEEPQPNTFSFNSPIGACTTCHGLGDVRDFDPALILGDETQSLEEGALLPLGKKRKNWLWAQVESLFDHYNASIEKPYKSLPKSLKDILINGSGDQKLAVEWKSDSGREHTYHIKFAGIMALLRQAVEKDATDSMREWAEQFMAGKTCPTCNGGRLKPEALFVRIEQQNIQDMVTYSLNRLKQHVSKLTFEGNAALIAKPIVNEILTRVDFLLNVGLEYLSLDRPAKTLSGGESQRIRLATQIGTQLVGVLYILDEPSIGLHQRDNQRLIHSLEQLRDIGNTVVVVEHDRDMMLSADLIADIGPAAGEYGGKIVAYATPELFKQGEAVAAGDFFVTEESPTAMYLSGRESLHPDRDSTVVGTEFLELQGATGNNLKSTNLKIPIGTLTCITGVSGSGKSTLVNETLAPILQRHFFNSNVVPLPYAHIEGLDKIDKVIEIDQTPIGRTPRSNPATYTGLFTHIRDFFAALSESKIRGYKVGRFSFNVKGGRCEDCEGAGMKKIEMNFLPDVLVTCETCQGKRYNRETLEVHFKGHSIADILAMSVTDALEVFTDIPRIRRKLDALDSVGLGYIRLGQQAPTLSGGEAQRVKLATELSKVATGKTLYILDEPTTGLHFQDVKHLLTVLLELRSRGNTVVVIEHNMDVIKMADWIIDLGPEGGEGGGRIISEGTPADVARTHKKTGSYTGLFLEQELAQ